ncbi:MAG TPA: hypothetical protein VKX17_28130 [Planctomycetota bacterium]|nr:hypothetical protein [Planctomycetota bacterium]
MHFHPFSDAVFGAGWSKPDDSGHLDPAHIKSIKIGCNPKDAGIVYSISDVRWVQLDENSAEE